MLWRIWGTLIIAVCCSAPVFAQSTGPPDANSAAPAAAGAPAAGGPRAPLPTLVPTRQGSFLIPFTVDETGELPVEVQLFISTDQGKSWQLFARRRPNEGQFRFQANGDGEYWFAPRTTDRFGRYRPSGPLHPELRVLVDTVQPDLQLEASVGPSGEARARWEIRDTQLDPESLHLEYQDALGSPWRKVAIQVARDGPRDKQLSGEVSWWAGDGGKRINVRGEVRDKAGNRSVVVRQLVLSGSTGDSVAARTRPEADPSAAGSNPSPQPIPRSPATSPLLPSRGVPSQSVAARTNRPWLPNEPPADNSGNLATRDQPAEPLAQRPSVEEIGRPPGRQVNEPEQPPPPATSLTASSRPSSTSPAVARRSSLADSEPSAPRVLPAGERPTMTNSRRFSLQYDVDAGGSRGIASVQLWATTDGGRSWALWGRDPDKQSPFDVEVDREGVYGFRIVVEANNGLAGVPPRAGDLADIWIGVDVTPPQVRLTSARYGQAEQAGRLIIEWDARDAWMIESPITLLFSDRREGPWQTVAAGLPNTGRYEWPADPRLPRQIYLRIEARDQAANRGVDTLSRPIDSQGLAPRGRIRAFSPGG